VVIPEGMDLCMMDITPETQPKPVVAVVVEKGNSLKEGLFDTQIAKKGSSPIEEYDPNQYNVAYDQPSQ